MKCHRTLLFLKHCKHSHILNKDGIYPSLFQLNDDSSDRFYLIVIDNGIESDINLSTKLMGVTAQLTDVINAVACCRTCSETWCTDIDGISTMIDSCDTTCQVLGWS